MKTKLNGLAIPFTIPRTAGVVTAIRISTGMSYQSEVGCGVATSPSRNPMPRFKNPIVFRVILFAFPWRIQIAQPVGFGVDDHDVALSVVPVHHVSLG